MGSIPEASGAELDTFAMSSDLLSQFQRTMAETSPGQMQADLQTILAASMHMAPMVLSFSITTEGGAAQCSLFILTTRLRLKRTGHGVHADGILMVMWPDSSALHCCAWEALRLPRSRKCQGMRLGLPMELPSTHSPVMQGGMPGLHGLEQLAPDLAASADAMPATDLLAAPGASQEHDSEQPSGVQAEVTSSESLLLMTAPQATPA